MTQPTPLSASESKVDPKALFQRVMAWLARDSQPEGATVPSAGPPAELSRSIPAESASLDSAEFPAFPGPPPPSPSSAESEALRTSMELRQAAADSVTFKEASDRRRALAPPDAPANAEQTVLFSVGTIQVTVEAPPQPVPVARPTTAKSRPRTTETRSSNLRRYCLHPD